MKQREFGFRHPHRHGDQCGECVAPELFLPAFLGETATLRSCRATD
jgi:hypothetical protein